MTGLYLEVNEIYLKVWTRNTFSELPEQRVHDLLELGRLDHVQDLLHFVEEHHFLRRMSLRPVF